MTANDQLNQLLEEGRQRYEEKTIEEKENLFYDTLDNYLLTFGDWHHRDPITELYLYNVDRTPFTIAYDVDPKEVRVYFVFRNNQDRSGWKPEDARW